MSAPIDDKTLDALERVYRGDGQAGEAVCRVVADVRALRALVRDLLAAMVDEAHCAWCDQRGHHPGCHIIPLRDRARALGVGT